MLADDTLDTCPCLTYCIQYIVHIFDWAQVKEKLLNLPGRGASRWRQRYIVAAILRRRAIRASSTFAPALRLLVSYELG